MTVAGLVERFEAESGAGFAPLPRALQPAILLPCIAGKLCSADHIEYSKRSFIRNIVSPRA